MTGRSSTSSLFRESFLCLMGMVSLTRSLMVWSSVVRTFTLYGLTLSHCLAVLKNSRSSPWLVFFNSGTKRSGSLANVVFLTLFTLDVVNNTTLFFSLSVPYFTWVTCCRSDLNSLWKTWTPWDLKIHCNVSDVSPHRVNLHWLSALLC